MNPTLQEDADKGIFRCGRCDIRSSGINLLEVSQNHRFCPICNQHIGTITIPEKPIIGWVCCFE